MFFPSVSRDLYFLSNVRLLLPLMGNNNSTTFIDESFSPKTVTRYGDVKISTAQSKWGSGSGYFDTDFDRLHITDSAIESGTNDFTIELWVYLISSKNFTCLINTQSGAGLPDGYSWGIFSDGKLTVFTDALRYSGNTVISTGVWVHLAMVRSGNNIYFFVNGVKEVNIWTTSASFLVPSFTIGGHPVYASQSLNGYLQDVRFTVGVARYTTDFILSGPLISNPYRYRIAQPEMQISFQQAAQRGL